MATLVGIHTDEELLQLFRGDGSWVNLDAFGPGSSQPPSWTTLLHRLVRLCRTGKVLDRAELEQCIIDNVGDITFEKAWQHSGRSICITITSDAPGTPNMLSHKTTPNVLIRTAALASTVLDPDKCLHLIKERGTRGEIQPWFLNDETPAYRDKRRAKGWPGAKPPINRVRELWQISHYIISWSRPYVLPFQPGKYVSSPLIL